VHFVGCAIGINP